MLITLKELIDALPALKKLYEQDLPLDEGYKLYKFAKEANRQLEFFITERQKISDKMDKKASGELGRLLETDVEMPDRIEISGTENIHLSAADIERLEKIVLFKNLK